MLKSLQLNYGGARLRAFGNFDSVEIGKKLATKENLLDATKGNVLDDGSIGTLTDEIKRT